MGKPIMCTVLSMISVFLHNKVVNVTANGIYGKRVNPQNQTKNLLTLTIFHDVIGKKTLILQS